MPMKVSRWCSLLASCSSVAMATGLAQTTPAPAGRPAVSLPASPKGSAAIEVGGTWTGSGDDRRYQGGSWITVDYSRPILRGRTNIFGAGPTYGEQVKGGSEVWRAGADDTTRLTTQVPLTFGSTTVQPGVYNVFVDLNKGAWTFILNTQPVQPKYDPNDKVQLYGAYNYNRKFDVLRVPMTVSTSPTTAEQFTISFVNVTAGRGSLAMAWEQTVATVEFRFGT
jgi:hypothetical protein